MSRRERARRTYELFSRCLAEPGEVGALVGATRRRAEGLIRAGRAEAALPPADVFTTDAAAFAEGVMRRLVALRDRLAERADPERDEVKEELAIARELGSWFDRRAKLVLARGQAAGDDYAIPEFEDLSDEEIESMLERGLAELKGAGSASSGG